MLGRPPLLESILAGPDAVERFRALVLLGRFEQAEEAAAGLAPPHAGGRAVAEMLLVRGEFPRAIEAATDAESAAVRARALAALGRFDEALIAAEAVPGPDGAALLAEVHLEAGDPGPAEVALGRSETPVAGGALAVVAMAERDRLRGEIRLLAGDAAGALEPLGAAVRAASRAGAAGIEARAAALAGEAHLAARNRWRALRAVTRALDRTREGRVEARLVAGIHVRAFEVYRVCGHAALARQAIESGHHRVVQLATQIEAQALREGFFLDNRDVHRLVAAWKGLPEWGAEVRRTPA